MHQDADTETAAGTMPAAKVKVFVAASFFAVTLLYKPSQSLRIGENTSTVIPHGAVYVLKVFDLPLPALCTCAVLL